MVNNKPLASRVTRARKVNTLELKEAEKDAIVLELKACNCNYQNVSEKYHINVKVLRNWIARTKTNTKLKSGNGRSSYLTSTQKENLKSLLSGKKLQLRTEEFNTVLNQMVAKTAREQGKQVPQLSRQWKHCLTKELGISTLNAEVTTHARVEGTSDVLNFISFAAMNKLYVEELKVKPHLILNADYGRK